MNGVEQFLLFAVQDAVSFLSQQLAGSPPKPSLAAQWPAIMAWVPIFVFGPLSVFLLDRVKT